MHIIRSGINDSCKGIFDGVVGVTMGFHTLVVYSTGSCPYCKMRMNTVEQLSSKPQAMHALLSIES